MCVVPHHTKIETKTKVKKKRKTRRRREKGGGVCMCFPSYDDIKDLRVGIRRKKTKFIFSMISSSVTPTQEGEM